LESYKNFGLQVAILLDSIENRNRDKFFIEECIDKLKTGTITPLENTKWLIEQYKRLL